MAEMYLTAEQVAARLQLHPETVRRQLKAGLLHGVRRGRVWRVPESALSGAASSTRTAAEASQAKNSAQNIARDLAAFDELDALVNRLPNARKKAGLSPLSDEEVFETISSVR